MVVGKRISKKTIEYKLIEFMENKIKITGIIVCVYFSDYLEITLPFSKAILDDLYIVTTNDDKKTHELCKKTNTKCLSIPRTTPDFLKGVYINHAFDNIPHSDWFLIFDVDIILPHKNMFDVSSIEEDSRCLYGAFCTYCNNYQEWIDYKDNGTLYNWKTVTRSSHVGMGAFQLFHTNHFNKKSFRYPPYTTTRIRDQRLKGCDFFFAHQFKRRECVKKLPFNVIHLNINKSCNKQNKKNENKI